MVTNRLGYVCHADLLHRSDPRVHVSLGELKKLTPLPGNREQVSVTCEHRGTSVCLVHASVLGCEHIICLSELEWTHVF
jgi:hypothetical protein